MNDDVLQQKRIEPIINDAEFVADTDLDALFRQAVAVAKEFGWTVPSREEFEGRYKSEIAASRKNQE